MSKHPIPRVGALNSIACKHLFDINLDKLLVIQDDNNFMLKLFGRYEHVFILKAQD
jgi:hypothetical protein